MTEKTQELTPIGMLSILRGESLKKSLNQLIEKKMITEDEDKRLSHRKEYVSKSPKMRIHVSTSYKYCYVEPEIK